MKSSVIARKEVQEVLKDFVFAELYTDWSPWQAENSKLLKERFKTAALPLYVTLGPDGTERSRLVGVSSTSEFIGFLKKGLNSTGRADSSYERALAEARRENRPLFLQFTGFTSLNSVAMRVRVIETDAVRDLLAKFVQVELPVDSGNEKAANFTLMKEKFQYVGQPFYVTLGPDGAERSRLAGLASTDQFVAFLNKGISPPGMK